MTLRILFVSFFLGLIPFLSLAQKTPDVTELCAEQTGKGAYYGDHLHGRSTASGEPYDTALMTTAHRTLAFGSMISVTNLNNNKTVELKVNDRGPFPKTSLKIVDVSKEAAKRLDMFKDGVVNVKIKVLSVGKNGERCTQSQALPEEKKEMVLNNTTYNVTGQALNYNIWGEHVDLSGHGILVGTYSRLESAIDASLEVYYKNFNQVFILADAPSTDKRIFRVIVGQGTPEQMKELANNLYKRGLSNLFLVEHKEVNKI